jgi:hypothetical protein
LQVTRALHSYSQAGNAERWSIFSGERKKKGGDYEPGNELSGSLVPSNESFEVGPQGLDIERQEGTMQLRHIRPGSLEWQDAIVDEGEQMLERLTPEETSRLRKLSEERRRLRQDDKGTGTEVQ